MGMNKQKLNDNELEMVIGGKGQGVDSGAARIVYANCPTCCKTPDETTRFEIIGNGPARCLTCNKTANLYKVERA